MLTSNRVVWTAAITAALVAVGVPFSCVAGTLLLWEREQARVVQQTIREEQAWVLFRRRYTDAAVAYQIKLSGDPYCIRREWEAEKAALMEQAEQLTERGIIIPTQNGD